MDTNMWIRLRVVGMFMASSILSLFHWVMHMATRFALLFLAGVAFYYLLAGQVGSVVAYLRKWQTFSSQELIVLAATVISLGVLLSRLTTWLTGTLSVAITSDSARRGDSSIVTGESWKKYFCALALGALVLFLGVAVCYEKELTALAGGVISLVGGLTIWFMWHFVDAMNSEGAPRIETHWGGLGGGLGGWRISTSLVYLVGAVVFATILSVVAVKLGPTDGDSSRIAALGHTSGSPASKATPEGPKGISGATGRRDVQPSIEVPPVVKPQDQSSVRQQP